MTTRTVERTDDWEAVPFSGGYGGLQALAAEEFSGQVIAGTARLFMLRGAVVGVLGGSIADFEGAEGTAREAPHAALPLLAVMQERGEEVRAKYYSEDTPLAEVDSTLADGNFTGYIELSENVLSGDYYQVYHQGRSESVAWVGAAERLITDEEAFEQADGEVGIYAVHPVEVEIEAVPEPAEDTSAAPADETDEVSGPEDDAAETGEATAGSAPAGGAAAEPEDAGPTAGGAGVAAAESGGAAEDTDAGTATEDAESPTTGAIEGATADPQPDAATDEQAPSRAAGTGGGQATDPPAPDRRTGGRTDQPSGADDGAEERERTRKGQQRGAGRDTGEIAANLETHALPSLDPERTAAASKQRDRAIPAEGTGRGGGTGADRTDQESGGPESKRRDPAAEETERAATQPSGDASTDSGEAAVGEPQEPPAGTNGGQTDEPAADTDAAPAEPEAGPAAESGEADGAATENDSGDLRATVEELEAERDAITTERDRLEAELSEAREELERLRDRVDEEADADVQVSPTEAIDETNLFVRYDSKGDATLETAHAGDAGRAAVEENLRLEYHTGFEAEAAAVDGEAFDAYLRETIQYRFASWLVGELLYEIRGTGHESEMVDLYDALPRIDRVELNGIVTVQYTEKGEEHRDQKGFDVVARDRMGDPLIVADINDSREPATEGLMTDLVTAAERVGESNDSLAGAVLLTKSYFEPPALETAAEATSGGILSRDKRKSFVNLSRKEGYHLCLVEARNREFHLTVPEL